MRIWHNRALVLSAASIIGVIGIASASLLEPSDAGFDDHTVTVVQGAQQLQVPSNLMPSFSRLALSVLPTGNATSCVTRPQDEYLTTSAAAVGVDGAKLQAALDYAAANGSNSIKVFRHGCLIGQGVRDIATDRVPELNAGQTKAVVALVAGIVADRGWIDLDAPIDAYLPSDLGDTEHRARTLRQFMQLTSGVQVNHVTGLNFFTDISRAREYFSTALPHAAGSYYEFDEITPSVVVYILDRIIKQHESNRDFQAFAQAELFNKLGIPASAYFWQKDRAGTTTGYSGLWLRPLEYGRLGELLRTGGTFDGRRVVSKQFITQMRAGSNANCGFGLYVWLNSCRSGETQVNTDYPSRRTYPGEAWIQSAPSDLYYSLGLGTNTFVIPSLDIVVTRAGYQELDTVTGLANLDLHGAFPGNAGGPGDHEFFRLLMDAITDMPVSVRATIQNSGPYDRPASLRVDVAPFLLPLTAPLGSYTALGPNGAEGCNALRCRAEPNDGILWVLQVPPALLGVIGLEQRPSG
ncbi:serine hydrolase [Sphingomonas sp. RHCKR47]|uniref:serine hydrolase domain-containing protein n=1 Tax=Sphingomonas citricola TaxID=2862498 RepID=UPI001CA5A2F6|nr:serine hydrolase [Sphingomonas citricola]MBW6522659.1 serine hydrolase [Sphingomonas citricola]